MKLPFLGRKKSPSQAVVFDLGSLWLKGLHVSQKDGEVTLMNFAFEKQVEGYHESPESLSECINKLAKKFGAPTRKAVVSLNGANSVMKQTLMPIVPLTDMRKMLKVGAQNYLGQNLEGHTFDCQPIDTDEIIDINSGIEGEESDPRKRVLVGGSQQSVVADLQQAFKKTKFALEHVLPNQVGIINAFEYSYPEFYKDGITGIIEVGHAYSTICVVDQGNVALTRNIQFGGRDLTREVSDHLNISFEEAEELKAGFSDEVDDFLEDRLESFVNEIQASIDFYTHTQERDIERVYVSGGSLLSNTVYRVIAGNMSVPCTPWKPADALEKRIPIGKNNDLEDFSSQLGTSVGAALAYLN